MAEIAPCSPGCAGALGALDAVRELAELLASSRYAIVFTGAGVSTESGIPDFRGPQGLWKRIDPEVFSIQYFMESPGHVWRLFIELFTPYRDARPNPAHYAIARLEELGIVKTVITQNIDGLHQAAGSKNVIELHGNLRYAVCLSCSRRIPLDEALGMVEKGRNPPTCPHCGGLLKPDAVFFGEPLPHDALERAFREAEKADLVLVVGSSLTVYPAAYIPAHAAQNGATLAIVNLDPTPLDSMARVVIRGRAGEVLPRVVELVERLVEGS